MKAARMTRTPDKKRRARRISAVLAVLIIALMIALGSDDNHLTNARYLLWKTGCAPSLYGEGLRYGFVDHDLQFLDGTSQTEIRRWFPVLTSCSECHDTYRQKYISRLHMTDADAQWVANTNYVLRFRNGGFYEIFLFKG